MKIESLLRKELGLPGLSQSEQLNDCPFSTSAKKTPGVSSLPLPPEELHEHVTNYSQRGQKREGLCIGVCQPQLRCFNIMEGLHEHADAETISLFST